MRLARLLLLAHLVAIGFALGGLLIALPHPELWAGSPRAVSVFDFGMRYAGSLYILLGAATMLAFGLVALGARRTLIFFVAAVSISLSAELIGTRTGWPFGNYAYTSGLGLKVLGRVPFTIPLSWFYVGFSAFLLGSGLAARLKRPRAVWSVALGAYLLTVWDLVLDPAMASHNLPARFWIWFQSGPYFGMPVKNFIGWTLTGILFMTVSRLLWRRGIRPGEIPLWLPFGVYLVNTVFAMALSLSVGLWQPALAAALFGWLPAWLAATGARSGEPRPATVIGRAVMRLGARLALRSAVTVEWSGLAQVPAEGPVLLACRHVHHLYDGCALLTGLPRPVHILVALDWVRAPWLRRVMEWACRTAGWPVVLRAERLDADGGLPYRPGEAVGYLRRAARESVELLRAGELLVVFPEGYPVVDPHYPQQRAAGDLLAFQPGFARLAALAERDGATRVSIVPVGVSWDPAGRRLALRCGAPLRLADEPDSTALVARVSDEVRRLSNTPLPELSTDRLTGATSTSVEA